VEHTYALFEGQYGIMNEWQLAMGESTCAARFWSAPVSAGGKARIEVKELSKIALERCKTARCAIEMMGDMAVKYGMYAADWSGGDMSKGEGGEALTVIDKEEAWVFHILSDDTGASAVWAAQRVPEDHVSAMLLCLVCYETCILGAVTKLALQGYGVRWLTALREPRQAAPRLVLPEADRTVMGINQ
jgi:dipeptidase